MNNKGTNAILLERYGNKIIKTTPEVLKETITDQELLNMHRQLQRAKVWREVGSRTSYDKSTGERVTKKTFAETNEPDYAIILRALEMAHRIRGDFELDKPKETKDSHKIYNIFYNPEVMEQVKNFDEMLKLKIYEQSKENNEQNNRKNSDGSS